MMGTRRDRTAAFSCSGIAWAAGPSSDFVHPLFTRFLKYTTAASETSVTANPKNVQLFSPDNLTPASCSASRTFRSASQKPGLSSACIVVSTQHSLRILGRNRAYNFELLLCLPADVRVSIKRRLNAASQSGSVHTFQTRNQSGNGVARSVRVLMGAVLRSERIQVFPKLCVRTFRRVVKFLGLIDEHSSCDRTTNTKAHGSDEQPNYTKM